MHLTRRTFFALFGSVPLLKALTPVIEATTPLRTTPRAPQGTLGTTFTTISPQGIFQMVRATEELHRGDLVEWVGDTYAIRKFRQGPAAGVIVAPTLSRGYYGMMQISNVPTDAL